jgi:hypothetical protein
MGRLPQFPSPHWYRLDCLRIGISKVRRDAPYEIGDRTYRKTQEILEVSVGFISKWKNAFMFGGFPFLKSNYK